jgi:hypothetical protein
MVTVNTQRIDWAEWESQVSAEVGQLTTQGAWSRHWIWSWAKSVFPGDPIYDQRIELARMTTAMVSKALQAEGVSSPQWLKTFSNWTPFAWIMARELYYRGFRTWSSAEAASIVETMMADMGSEKEFDSRCWHDFDLWVAKAIGDAVWSHQWAEAKAREKIERVIPVAGAATWALMRWFDSVDSLNTTLKNQFWSLLWSVALETTSETSYATICSLVNAEIERWWNISQKVQNARH